MSPSEIFGLAGTLSAVLAAAAVLFASLKTNTAKVWREEAEAQKSRADRLEASLKEINTRLSRIEIENERLVQLLTSLDPTKLAVIRLATIPTEE
jgi:small-conductance mechanosensitive channel